MNTVQSLFQRLQSECGKLVISLLIEGAVRTKNLQLKSINPNAKTLVLGLPDQTSLQFTVKEPSDGIGSVVPVNLQVNGSLFSGFLAASSGNQETTLPSFLTQGSNLIIQIDEPTQ